MTLDEAKEILEDAGYILDEGILAKTLGAGALAAGLAFGNSGVPAKPVKDDSFGKGKVVHLQQRYNMDQDRYGVPTDYKIKSGPKTQYTVKQEIELTKKKILATPDSMLRKYGRENLNTIAKYMVNTANKYNIDVDILLSIAGTETNFDNNRTSPVGARGMMQITKIGAYDSHIRLQGKPEKTFNFKDIDRLKTNIDNAGRIVADLSKRRSNIVEMIFASYNGGTKEAFKWKDYKAGKKSSLSNETKDYVDRCMALYKVYKQVQKNYKAG